MEKQKRVIDPKSYMHTFRLNEQQQVQFEKMMLTAGQRSQSKFILSRIFGWPFRVVQTNKDAHDYYLRLTNLYAQIRAVGVNYNQTVKAIHTNFNDRRAVALLARLEKYTQELTLLFGQVVRLTEEFNRRWSAE